MSRYVVGYRLDFCLSFVIPELFYDTLFTSIVFTYNGYCNLSQWFKDEN